MKQFSEVIDGIRKAIMASEVREDIAQMGEYVEQFANTAGENIQKAIDPTLSLSGKAADAKSAGNAIQTEKSRATNAETALDNKKADKTDLDTERKRIDVLNDGGLNLKDDVIDTSIKAWLTEHPEATTTVQDGSIIETKINSDFLQYIKKDYVTPEMFGAVGDGVTDDTSAIQNAIYYAKNNNKGIYGGRTYYTLKTIIFDGFNILNAVFNKIKYGGTGNAILITNCSRSKFEFYDITASNGSCIKYFSDSNKNNHVSYTTLNFRFLNAKEKCIHMEIGESDGYVNENLIYGGWLNSGEYGIYADAKGRAGIQFKAYNIGFEGVSNCVYLYGTSSCIFTNCRYAEYIDTPLITSNGAKYIFWIGINKFYSKRLKLSSNTTGRVIAPICEDYGGIIAYDGVIENDMIIPSEAITNRYKNTLGKPLDLTSYENYLTAFITYFNVSTGTGSIKLNKLYGSKNGIKQFICRLSFGSSDESFSIYDADGKLIFNNGNNINRGNYRFTWQSEVGWICEKINTITS